MRLAIVGDGASAVIMLSNLLRSIGREKIDTLSVYSNSHVVGPGKAYQWDIHSPLMNLPNYSITVDDIDTTGYVHWLRQSLNNETRINPFEYSSRRIFGRYLRYAFLRVMAQLEQRGVKTEIIHSAATTLSVDNDTIINQGMKTQRVVDKVIFCPGVATADGSLSHAGNSTYFHDPYPLCATVNKIAPEASVTVLGAGLTAVDIARALLERKHTGKITLISRSGKLPRVRNARIVTRPVYATPGFISRLIDEGKITTLKDIVEVIKTEFQLRHLSLFPLLKWVVMKGDAGRELRWQLRLMARHYEGMELALNIIHPNLEKLWQALTHDERNQFNTRWRSRFMCFMNPMPEGVAMLFSQAFQRAQLTVVKNDARAAAGEATDYVFNAISPSGETRYLHKDASRLLGSLISQKVIDPHLLGGIQVAVGSGAAVGHHDLYFLGHVTNGTHLLTNSLVALSRQAKQIADTLCKG